MLKFFNKDDKIVKKDEKLNENVVEESKGIKKSKRILEVSKI